MKNRLIFLIMLPWLFLKADAQNIKDTSMAFPYLKVGYSYQFPGGDMLARFGNNSALHTGFYYKTTKNFYAGLEGGFFFSEKIKERGILDSIKTSQDFVINGNGELTEPRLYERGYTVSIKAGKIFPLTIKNKNSGIMVQLSGGFIQHKIRIEDIGNNSPQISKEYKKGYDRLTNGLYLQGFVGYVYFSNNQLFNFYTGFEYGMGLTQNRRSFNFDTMEQDLTKRNDILFGPKIGLIIPFYKKNPEPFYYN